MNIPKERFAGLRVVRVGGSLWHAKRMKETLLGFAQKHRLSTGQQVKLFGEATTAESQSFAYLTPVFLLVPIPCTAAQKHCSSRRESQ